MEGVVCPGCGETVSVGYLKAGDRVDCPNCANLTLRVKKRGEEHYLEEIPKVSCPSCDQVLEVPDGLRPGDTMTCCSVEGTLTYEFGAFALAPSGKDEIN